VDPVPDPLLFFLVVPGIGGLLFILIFIIIYINNLIRHFALSSMVFEMEMHYVSCEVRTEYLNIIIFYLFYIILFIILYIINLIWHLALSSMVFEMEMHCDSCEVRTEYLNVIYINIMLQWFMDSTEA
jgi:hypothetical protein